MSPVDDPDDPGEDGAVPDRLVTPDPLPTTGGADEPVDRRVFELVDGRLVEFDGGRHTD